MKKVGDQRDLTILDLIVQLVLFSMFFSSEFWFKRYVQNVPFNIGLGIFVLFGFSLTILIGPRRLRQRNLPMTRRLRPTKIVWILPATLAFLFILYARAQFHLVLQNRGTDALSLTVMIGGISLGSIDSLIAFYASKKSQTLSQ